MRWIKRLGWLLVGLLLLAAGGIAGYGYLSVPAANASYAVKAKLGATTVRIDSDGIPTIEAQSERDLAFAVGFMHARDRLWQLEMHRRIGRGELAEILGPKALDTDRFIRTLGVHRAAQRQLDSMPAESRQLLQAYADGVNRFVNDAMTVRPPEFVLIGIEPGAWQPVDTVAWAIMMAYDLGGNWSNELLRLQLAARLPVSRIDELLPAQPGDQLPAHSDYTALYKSVQALPAAAVPSTTSSSTGWPGAAAAGSSADSAELAAWLGGGIDGVGSNNWVVNGSRTVSGKPLLANDPHLSLAAPAIWYFTRQKAPGIEVTGATLPGGHAVILGRTKGVAWGFTNTGPDVQDLYLEEINDRGEARTPDGWRPLAVREETIRVKGGQDVTIRIRESRHGPIISDANAPMAAAIDTRRFGLALRWTALDADNHSVRAAPLMNRANSVAELRDALRLHTAPQQNVVMADTVGSAAFLAAGRVPVRKPDNDINGLAPSPGWDARYDWAGYLPFDDLPTQVVSTFLATANQRIHGKDYPHFLSGEWAHPGRRDRIEALLAARPRHDAASLREIQQDVQHTHDMPLLKWLPRLQSKHPLAADAVRVLDQLGQKRVIGAVGEPAAGALVYWSWTREVTQRLLADKMGSASFKAVFGRRDFRTAVNGMLLREDAFWCNNGSTPDTESCDDVVRASFDAALDALQSTMGKDMAAWRWDSAHFARSEHRPFSNVPILRDLFEVRTPTAGDTYTVMVGKVRLRDPNPFANEFAASLRAVYDLSVADANAASIIYSTGQSGNPFSPHYRDLAQRWGSGGPEAYLDLARSSVAGTLQLHGEP